MRVSSFDKDLAKFIFNQSKKRKKHPVRITLMIIKSLDKFARFTLDGRK